MQQELNMETPKSDHENPPPDIINIISSWLEVDDIYTPAALPTDHHQELQAINDFQMVDDQDHHQDDYILGFNETSNEPVDDLLQAFLPTPEHHHEEDPPLFLFDDLYSLFHENVPAADQITTQPQYYPLLDQNPQPHVEPEPENAVLDECNLFLLDDDELINLANINTPDHNEENASHYNVLNVTTTTSTTTSVSSYVVGTSEPMRTTDEIIGGHVRGENDEENEAEFMEDDDDDDDNPSKQQSNSTSNSCKNLVSERNRRKRLGQQLLALRALVPNITRMDKRSVLVDALAYLRSIHEEITRLQKERKQHHHQPNLSLNFMSTTPTPNDDIPSSSLDCLSGIPRMLISADSSKSKTMITEIEIEKIEDRRFIVKITCKNGTGVGGNILRLIESLGFDITYTSLLQKNPQQRNHQEVLIILFIRILKVKKQEKMTEEKLRDCIWNRALRLGLTFAQNP